MNIREITEKIELSTLSKYAALSSNSKGRQRDEPKCQVRTEYQRDRDRIIHSKAFRRLKHKSQVFIAPEGDHYRTRLTHTLEVAQISRTIARALRLNEDLTEAIALGHDLGHTPFGHTGEHVLNHIHKNGFKHNIQSLKVIDFIEHRKNKSGLNLTYEVRDGILNHTGSTDPITLEGKIVKIADRIAYINHDIDDAIRAGIINEYDLPKDCLEVLGYSHGERINSMIVDIIKNSMDKNDIRMSEEVAFYTNKIRNFMFNRVYLNKTVKSEEEKAWFIIETLYNYYKKNFEKLPYAHRCIYNDKEVDKDEIVCDYIAGMTDRYAIKIFNDLFVPLPWDK